jgi:hypothetical protein
MPLGLLLVVLVVKPALWTALVRSDCTSLESGLREPMLMACLSALQVPLIEVPKLLKKRYLPPTAPSNSRRSDEFLPRPAPTPPLSSFPAPVCLQGLTAASPRASPPAVRARIAAPAGAPCASLPRARPKPCRLSDRRQRNRPGVEIDRLAASDIQNTPVGQHHAQTLHPGAGGAIAEAPRPAGVARDIADQRPPPAADDSGASSVALRAPCAAPEPCLFLVDMGFFLHQIHRDPRSIGFAGGAAFTKSVVSAVAVRRTRCHFDWQILPL